MLAAEITHFLRKLIPPLPLQVCINIVLYGAILSQFRTPKHILALYGTSLQYTAQSVTQASKMCYNEHYLGLLGNVVNCYPWCYTFLQKVIDRRTMYYDEPHGTIFDSLAGSQKAGNDHGTNCTFTIPPGPLMPPHTPWHYHP